MRRLALAALVAVSPSLLAAEPPAVPQAVAALQHLRPRTDQGPVSWTAGPYKYDASGNIQGIGSEAYVYDKLGRLKSATLRGPDMTSLQTQSFDYDVYGNLTATAKLGQTVLLPTAAGTNRLETLGYDASGNVITAGTLHYSYDAVGMLNTVHVGAAAQPRIIYAYTADDERLFAFDVSTSTTHWTLRGLDNKVLRDFKQVGSTWSVDRDYIYRDGLLLAALKSSGAVEHYTLDHLGTPRLITDAAGHKVGYHVYWPFGEEWSPGTAQEASPLKFTAHERDADPTGAAAPLDYMHARYYGAGWGRFFAVDPAMDLKKTMLSPQMWNRYAYVSDNPLRSTDPDGRDTLDKVNGFANAFGSDNMLGAGRVDSGNDDFKEGQHAGDFAAAVVGLIELGMGLQRGGEAVAASSSGVGILVNTTGLLSSGARILHGGTTTAIASIHMMAGPDGGKKAADLISGSLKKSRSYRSEVENKTKAEIDRLAKDKGPFQQAAKQMKKLIEQAERLRDKIRNK